MAKGMSGHQSTNMITDVWLTPPDLIQSLGEFDLDPCSPLNRPWDTAKRHYTIEDDGLLMPWFGRVWLNPPYGRELSRWMEKMALHQQGIALIFARTDTQVFHRYIFNTADSILFIENRITFHTPDGKKGKGNGGAPSVLIAYGEENVDAIEKSGIKGKHVFINTVPLIIVGMHGTWKSIVTVAFNRINSEASLQRIYDIVSQIAPDRVGKNKFYKEKIRQVLQQHFNRIRTGVYSLN